MKKYFVIALVLLFQQIILPQGSIGVSDARSAGMGKTSVMTANGLFAIGNNPANLFQSGKLKRFEITAPLPVPNISAKAGTNIMTLDDYDYFFGQEFVDEDGNTVGRYLTNDDKERLKSLFDNGGEVFINVAYNLFGVSYKLDKKIGTIAFSINDVVAANATFPKDIINLGMDGNAVNRVYNFNDMQMKAWWLRKYSLSYATNVDFFRMFKEFTVGVSLNYVQGFAYAGIDHVQTNLTTDDNNVITGRGEFLAYSSFSDDFHVKYDFDSTAVKEDANVSPFPKSAGNGFGFDFGINAKLTNAVSFGFSVTDIGKIKWNKNVAEFNSNTPLYLDDLTDKDQRDSLIDAITGKGSGKYISEISTDLAQAMSFGASIQIDKMFGRFPGKMLVAVSFNKGFNDQPGNSTKARFALGADWQPFNYFAFRTGFSFGGIEKFGWGLGLGLDFGLVEMNFGTPDMHYVLSQSNSKRITFACNSRWKF